MYRVLFVCSGNTCRSPLAKALFDKVVNEDSELKGKVGAGSCGISTHFQETVQPNAVTAGRKLGVDIADHRSNQFSPEYLKEFDVVIGMSKGHRDTITAHFPEFKDRVKTLYEFNTGDKDAKDVKDPYGCDQDTYDKIAGELNEQVRIAAEKIKKTL